MGGPPAMAAVALLLAAVFQRSDATRASSNSTNSTNGTGQPPPLLSGPDTFTWRRRGDW